MFGWLKGKSEAETHYSRKASLEGIPVLADFIRKQDGPDGEMLLLIPRKPRSHFIYRYFMTDDAPPIKFLLDELGAGVVRQINGVRNVKEIIENFQQETKLHPREAEAGVVSFLNTLMTKGLIVVMMKK